MFPNISNFGPLKFCVKGFLKDFNYEDSTQKKTFRHHGCLREDIVLVEIVLKVKSLCRVRIVVQNKK